jgi:hypothetical protein
MSVCVKRWQLGAIAQGRCQLKSIFLKTKKQKNEMKKNITRACKKFCVNATEQISDRIFEYDHQTQS